MASTDGVLLVDKPAGITSHDVVAVARRVLRIRRIGHAGTLDPFATGLLVLLTGRATRLLPYLDDEPKVYDATITFGAATDTDDATGTVTATAPLPAEDAVRRAIPALTGAIDQIPPAYSAKQVDGERAYDAARRGAPLALKPARITVERWEVRAWRDGALDATITCSGGTYIRALARDLGRLAGSAAHLSALRRTRAGTFRLEQAATVAALQHGDVSIQPALAAVASLPTAALDAARLARLAHGMSVEADVATGAPRAALTDGAGQLVAIAEPDAGRWHPRVVFTDG